MDGPALPLQTRAHDALRQGLASLKEDAGVPHPVEQIQAESQKATKATQQQMLRDLYGIAAPARAEIETQILSKFTRLPGGAPSSLLGLESLTGELDEFRYESYLGLPDTSVLPPVNVHSQMEARLGLAGAGKDKMARGLL
jgi:proteasome maturation protein